MVSSTMIPFTSQVLATRSSLIEVEQERHDPRGAGWSTSYSDTYCLIHVSHCYEHNSAFTTQSRATGEWRHPLAATNHQHHVQRRNKDFLYT